LTEEPEISGIGANRALVQAATDDRQFVPCVAASPEADPKNLRNFSETRLISDAKWSMRWVCVPKTSSVLIWWHYRL